MTEDRRPTIRVEHFRTELKKGEPLEIDHDGEFHLLSATEVGGSEVIWEYVLVSHAA